jgi:hypothetical protein
VGNTPSEATTELAISLISPGAYLRDETTALRHYFLPSDVAHYFVAVGAGIRSFLMIPSAAGADSAGDEHSISFVVHGFHNFTYQTATGVLRTPVTATGFSAVAGKPKPFFGLADLLAGGINESLVNDDWFFEVLNMAGSILNTKKSGTGLSSRAGT